MEVGEGREAGREGAEYNKVEHAGKMEMKRSKMTGDLVRKAENEREFPLSESLHSGLGVKVKVAQSCLILCNPIDCSPPDSSVHGILQARVLEDLQGIFSSRSSQPRDWTQVSGIADRFLTLWATRTCHNLLLHRATFRSVWHRGEAGAPWEPNVSPAAGAGHSFQANLSPHYQVWVSTDPRICSGWRFCAWQAVWRWPPRLFPLALVMLLITSEKAKVSLAPDSPSMRRIQAD